MTAKTHSISRVPKTVASKVVVSFSEITAARISLDVRAIYVIGSSVGKLLEGKYKLGNDIDIVFFVSEEIARGQELLPGEVFKDILAGIGQQHHVRIGFSYNGIPRVHTGDLVIDIIPARVSDVEKRLPQVIIDMCNRDNIHVARQPILAPLMNSPVTPELVAQRLEIAQRYLEREFARPVDERHLEDYIVKCFGFALEMASNFTHKPDDSVQVLLTSKQQDETVSHLADLLRQAFQLTNDTSGLVTVFGAFSASLAAALRRDGFLKLTKRTNG
jgi:hypothetical protein